MNKMNLKNYWISKLIIILGIFFLNSANAAIKIKASQQVSNFLNTIKEFASEKDSLIKIKRSDELLDMVDSRQPTSRLSCQIKVTEQMDGLIVRLPESQF